MSSGRNHQGCWTCRLRHKRCDEAKPACRACEQRDLVCHGYGDRPAWFDGGDEERAQLTKIKAAVKQSLKRRNVAHRACVSTQAPTSSADADSPLPSVSPSTLTALRNSSTASTGDRITSYREAELLMHYIDHVFPLQFRFYAVELRNASRSWLFWLLISTGPLYHAALSLSALHQFKLEKGLGNVATELPSYHARALNDLHSFLGDIREVGNTDSINEQIQILSCGVSLISFELFRGGNNDWRPHLDALTSLPVVRDSSLLSIAELEQWQKAALSFFIPVTLWFDLLACASTGAAPRLPYPLLLDTQFGNLQSVMGCESWVMGIIGDLANLNHWKSSQQGSGILSIPELVAKSRGAEQRLEGGIGETESCSSRLVTRVFAAGALVYLHSIVSGPFPGLKEIQRAAALTLNAAEVIEDPQMIRGLIWPVCIAACLATPNIRPRFEEIITQAVSVSGDFGNCNSVLSIANTCWRLQDSNQASPVDWRQAMDHLGTYLLLV